MTKIGARNCLYPVLTGLLSGAAAIAAGMLLSAFIAVKACLPTARYPLLLWVILTLGGFLAGLMGAGTAKEYKLLCGMIPAAALWIGMLLGMRSFTLSVLTRGIVMLGAAFIGCILAAGKGRKSKRQKKWGKTRMRARPHKGYT